jgi:hypothetical protein
MMVTKFLTAISEHFFVRRILGSASQERLDGLLAILEFAPRRFYATQLTKRSNIKRGDWKIILMATRAQRNIRPENLDMILNILIKGLGDPDFVRGLRTQSITYQYLRGL